MGIEKMIIAVIFEGSIGVGGGYQQQLSTIITLKKSNKFNFIAFVFSVANRDIIESYGIKAVLVKKTFLKKASCYFLRQKFFYPFILKFKIKTYFDKIFIKHNIDLIYFLSPSFLSLDIFQHNYIITVWDLCHRDVPEFPEVNFFREFEKREYLYGNSLKKAVAILSDSELGKRNISTRYNIDINRVFVAPFSASINIDSRVEVDIKLKYKIKTEYIYYPAQFWAHKNHVYIIDAISLLKNEGMELTAIFSGSDAGNLNSILDYAKYKKVQNNIKYIGFAPNKEIYSLYEKSLALVMPSYFGPTNIPPLEAFSVGTPVIYSNLDGFKAQVGDAALLCNLNDPKNLAYHLKCLLESEKLRASLIDKGKRRLLELNEKISVEYMLEQIFDDYAVKLKSWKFK